LILIYLRKLHWDIIHHNLFDLSDEIGGKIVRHGFASRPFYYGIYQGYKLTVNFSSEKTKRGRKNYLDISINRKIDKSITIASVKWLKENNADLLKNFIPFRDQEINKYGISICGKQSLCPEKLEQNMKEYIKNMDNFNFIFLGGSGVLLEIVCDNLAYASKHPRLKLNIDTLLSLVKVLT
jgi:hypothetical protein